MKLGIVSLWRESLESFVEEIEQAEAMGFDLIGVGDSQAGYRELYASLAVAALHSRDALIGPIVTNPVTRHPAVTASAVGAIDRLAPGRAVVGFGTGGSAVWTIGQKPAPVADFKEYLAAVAALFRNGEAMFQGNRIEVQGLERAVPIYISAEGPRTLALAGAVADGVILHSGTTPEAVGWCLDQIALGAERSGRDPQDIDVWMMLKASIAADRQTAVSAVAAGLAGSAHHALRYGAVEKGVPEHLLNPVAELIRRYDPAVHGVAGSANADLVDSLGLTDFLADYFGLVGTPADCASQLDDLADLGVDGVICPSSAADPLKLIRQLGDDVRSLIGAPQS